MKLTIDNSQDYLRKIWFEIPWWFIYLSTAPSMLLWFGIIVKASGPVLATLMILTLGIPTKLLHYVFARFCILNCKKPTIPLHILLFLTQCAVYLVLFYLITKP